MATERFIIQVDERGSRTVQRGLRGIGSAGTEAKSQVAGLQTALIALGGALVLRQSIGLLASFSQEMSTVRAITGATNAEFAGLTDVARELGATTRFSASEAAQGLTFLARAGFNATEAIETIDDTLNLAQAGALDLGRAADIASNVLRGFRLDTDQASRVVDVLALAANKSNTNVEQLGDALKFVAPIAAGVGLEIEETTAAISALSDAGLQASLAGTGLRRILSELESPSRKSQVILHQLGVTAEEVRVSEVGLTNALRELAEAGIDTGQALELFGDRGGPAFEVLRTAVRDGTVTKMKEQLDDAGGTAKRVADIMDANLNGALLALKSAAQEVVLAFGEMGGSMNILEKVVRGLASALRFLGRHVEIVAGVLTVLLIPAIKTTFGLISKHPVGLLLVALGAAIGALVSFKDEILATGDGMTTLGDVIAVVGENFQESFRFIEDTARTSLVYLGVLSSETADSFNLSFRTILTFAAYVFDSIPALGKGAFSALVAAFQNLPAAIGDLFFKAVNFALEQVQNLINKGIEFLNKLIIETERVVNMIRIELGKDPILLSDLIKPVKLTIENPYVNNARELGGIVAEAFKIGFHSYGTPMVDAVDDIFDRAEQRAREREAQAARMRGWEARGTTGGAVGAALGGPGLGAAGTGIETLGRVFAQMAEGTQIEEFFQSATEAVSGFTDQIERTNDKVEETPGFLDGMDQALKQLNASSLTLGRSIGDSLVGAFDEATGALADFAMTGFRSVEDLQKAFSDLFSNLARDILQMILRMLLLRAIGGGLGGTGEGSGIVGALGGLFGGGGGERQAGGPVAGGVPYVVGERGPELFVPPNQGNIVPNNQLGGGDVNLTVVNVDEKDSVPRGMNTPEGEEVILNTIARNPNAVRRVLG